MSAVVSAVCKQECIAVRSVAVVLEDSYFARSVVRHYAPVVGLALVLASPIGTSSPCGDWGSWIAFIISHSGEFALCFPPQLAHFGSLWTHPCRLVQLRHEWVVVSWCGSARIFHTRVGSCIGSSGVQTVGRVCIGRLDGRGSIPPSCVVFQRSLFHIVGGA